jgi:hypothetical protein
MAANAELTSPADLHPGSASSAAGLHPEPFDWNGTRRYKDSLLIDIQVDP